MSGQQRWVMVGRMAWILVLLCGVAIGFYLWLLGGTPVYCLALCLFILQCCYTRTGKNYQILVAVLTLIGVMLLVSYSRQFLFFQPFQFCLLLPSLIVLLSQVNRRFKALKSALLVLVLSAVALLATVQIQQLQHYYAQYQSNETWQQYGAL